MNLFSYLAVIVLAVTTVSCSVASDHECNRRCEVGQPPMRCVYNFTVEWYRTLSKACHDCPFTQEDCFRPHCVTADGGVRAHLTVNRMMPGPSIEVCENDTIVAYVTNSMEDAGTTSIHWHGMHQFKTPYMDGAAQVTQCGINMKETFRYEFTASPAGTHWYHSHTALQVADGLLGALIVRTPKDVDPSGLLYEEDRSDHIMVISDWLPIVSTARFMDHMHDRFSPFWPMSGLINGRAKVHPVVDRQNASVTPTQTPMEVFNVEANKTYRFRVIGATSLCAMKLAIDSHQMTVIASDGMPIEPRIVSTMIIHEGERFDIVVHTAAAVDNYVIRVWGVSWCLFVNTQVYAILHYNGASDNYPDINSTVSRGGVFLNPILINNNETIYTSKELDINVDEIRSERYGRVENYTTEQVDRVDYIAFDFNNNDNKKFNHPVYYPVQELPPFKAHVTPVLNNITFDLPPIPLLSQPYDIQPHWFCNRSTVNMTACSEDLCICTHMINLKLNEVADLILVNEGKRFPEVGHPMHLHGHSFRVLGLEQLGDSVSLSKVQNLEKEGRLKRNLINPPWKDTVNVPDGGYVIIRVIANNPGYWFFHCHIDSHRQRGMAMLIKVGEAADIPDLPPAFPRCGGMGFSNAITVAPTPSMIPTICNGSSASSTFHYKIVHAFLIILLFVIVKIG